MAPDGPVTVTVEVPVSGGDETIEVTVTLSARRVEHYTDDGYDADPEPEPQPEPPRPSAVVGGGRIHGIAAPRD